MFGPADLIEPEMDQAREAVIDITSELEDVLTYALYPTTDSGSCASSTDWKSFRKR